MYRLSDQLLVYTYKQARKLQLDPIFIKLLEEELKRRSLSIKSTDK